MDIDSIIKESTSERIKLQNVRNIDDLVFKDVIVPLKLTRSRSSAAAVHANSIKFIEWEHNDEINSNGNNNNSSIIDIAIAKKITFNNEIAKVLSNVIDCYKSVDLIANYDDNFDNLQIEKQNSEDGSLKNDVWLY